MEILNYPSVQHSTLPEQGKSVTFKHYRYGWLSGKFTTHTGMGACFFAQRDDFNTQWGWFDTESVLEWKY